MGKALHDCFYMNTGHQELKFRITDESANLIKAANFHVDRGNGMDRSESIRVLDAFYYECMDEYLKNGVSDYLLNKLNEILKSIEIKCRLKNIGDKLIAVHVAYMPRELHILVLGAYIFSNVTSLDGFEGLRRCASKDCLKFFKGRSNAKWCSNTCGSKSRVTKMRKNKQALCGEQFL